MRQILASFSQDIKSSSKRMSSNFGRSEQAKISRQMNRSKKVEEKKHL